jgi:hypothetical protein
VLDGAELDHFAVGGGEDGVGVGVERAGAGLEGAVEEGGEVGVDVQVGFGDFVQAVVQSVLLQRQHIWKAGLT